jgi:hypothetical protein
LKIPPLIAMKRHGFQPPFTHRSLLCFGELRGKGDVKVRCVGRNVFTLVWIELSDRNAGREPVALAQVLQLALHSLQGADKGFVRNDAM